MDTFWIVVYRDTIEKHNEDNNLSAILVSEDFVEQYFNECIFNKLDYAMSLGDWLMEYTADETMDFYQYAKEHNAIIEIQHLRDWIEEADEIDKDCILHWEYLLGRKLVDYDEYSMIDSMIDEMVIEWEDREEFFDEYPELKKYMKAGGNEND